MTTQLVPATVSPDPAPTFAERAAVTQRLLLFRGLAERMPANRVFQSEAELTAWARESFAAWMHGLALEPKHLARCDQAAAELWAAIRLHGLIGVPQGLPLIDIAHRQIRQYRQTGRVSA